MLLAAIPMSITSLTASESLVPSNAVEDDHAYETVIHYDQKLKGYVIGEGWKITGDLRTGYVSYDYSNDPTNPDPAVNKGHLDSNGIYVIPKLSIASPDYHGLTFKITGAGATDFGLNDPRYESRNFVFDPTEKKSFAILQEAYLSYETADGKHRFLVGAKETVTPMIDADDWYMLSNSFQGAYYMNKSFENIMMAAGYFYKMAGVWDSGANGTEWHTMARASFAYGSLTDEEKRRVEDNGVWAGVFQYNDGAHNLQIWDYYATDLYNTLFAQYDYSGKVDAYGLTYDAGVQFIDFQEVGVYKNNPNHTIDYSLFSLRLNTKHDNGFDTALGASFYSDGDGTGDTLGAWGGYPYFANGMIFHFFEAGSLRNANSYKAQVGYNFAKEGAPGLWAGVRYTHFDLDPNYSKNGYGDPQDAMNLYGVRVSYNAKGGFYFTGTYEKVDLDNEPGTDSLRLIGGYKF